MSINAKQLKIHVIVPTLVQIGLYSDAAVNLLLGTCAQESQMGTYLKQINGPALGIYQIEPATHKDVWENYLRYKKELSEKVLMLGAQHDASLMINLAYTTAIARIIYLRAPEKLPAENDISELANYWKKYYNTLLGKGSTTDFITNYKRYINV
jgi:hypothetical protein